MIAVLSELASEQFEKSTGIKALSLKPYNKLDVPVASHADMLICVIDKTVFCYKDYYSSNITIFNAIKECGYDIVITEKECGSKYPNDIALNVLVADRKIFCNKKHTAREIIDFATVNGYKIIDVKQGYASCSTLLIDKSLAITADKGMKKALDSENIDTLLISNEGIKLRGYNCGFIGGTGVSMNDKVYLFGNIKNHPSYKTILDAIEKKGLSIIEVVSNDLYDFGGVKLLWMLTKIKVHINYKKSHHVSKFGGFFIYFLKNTWQSNKCVLY